MGSKGNDGSPMRKQGISNTLACASGSVVIPCLRFSKADISRTKRDLGYKPDVTFEEGLKRTLEWYQVGARSASKG